MQLFELDQICFPIKYKLNKLLLNIYAIVGILTFISPSDIDSNTPKSKLQFQFYFLKIL